MQKCSSHFYKEGLALKIFSGIFSLLQKEVLFGNSGIMSSNPLACRCIQFLKCSMCGSGMWHFTAFQKLLYNQVHQQNQVHCRKDQKSYTFLFSDIVRKIKFLKLKHIKVLQKQRSYQNKNKLCFVDYFHHSQY